MLHDTHNTAVVKQLLAKKRFTVIYRSLYLPDLALAEYLLFFKVNSNLLAIVLTPFQISRTCDE
jgi:hypothetical protein